MNGSTRGQHTRLSLISAIAVLFIAGEAELVNELESLCSAVASFDVVEPMPDDGDVTEVAHQLQLCVVGFAHCLS